MKKSNDNFAGKSTFTENSKLNCASTPLQPKVNRNSDSECTDKLIDELHEESYNLLNSIETVTQIKSLEEISSFRLWYRIYFQKVLKLKLQSRPSEVANSNSFLKDFMSFFHSYKINTSNQPFICRVTSNSLIDFVYVIKVCDLFGNTASLIISTDNQNLISDNEAYTILEAQAGDLLVIKSAQYLYSEKILENQDDKILMLTNFNDRTRYLIIR